jgi:hypothetical protein
MAWDKNQWLNKNGYAYQHVNLQQNYFSAAEKPANKTAFKK